MDDAGTSAAALSSGSALSTTASWGSKSTSAFGSTKDSSGADSDASAAVLGWLSLSRCSGSIG